MNLPKLVWRNMVARKLTSLLTVGLLSLGVGVVSLLLLVGQQMQDRMQRDGRGFDLVVGAKGSPLQLILSSIYHLDIPTGNIPLAEAEKFMRNPYLKEAIPLALGDSHRGFRIVGAPLAYPKHYGAKLARGKFYARPMQAVAGAEAAKQLGLKVGDEFTGSHGLEAGGDAHARHAYTVTGVLKPSGSVLDRLLLTPVESVWKVHEHAGEKGAPQEEGEAHEEEAEHHEEEAPKEVTALLLSFRSPIVAVTMPRMIQQNSALMGARPAAEMARLFGLLGVGLDVMSALGKLLVAMAGFSLLVALLNALNERRYDLAIMRTLGASRGKVFAALMLEGLGLSLLGGLLGLVLGHVATAVLAVQLAQAGQLALTGWLWLGQEGWLLAGVLGVGLLASVLPAWLATRLPVADVLAQGG